MAIQEIENVRVVLSPYAKEARLIDLLDKVGCWTGHIRIAQENGDLRQTRIGKARLGEIQRQMDVKDQTGK